MDSKLSDKGMPQKPELAKVSEFFSPPTKNNGGKSRLAAAIFYTLLIRQTSELEVEARPELHLEGRARVVVGQKFTEPRRRRVAIRQRQEVRIGRRCEAAVERHRGGAVVGHRGAG